MESKGLAGCKHHAVKSWAQTQTSSELPPPASPVSPSSRSAIKQSFRDFSFITQHFCVGFNTFFKQRWSSFSSDTLTWLFPVNPFIVFLFFFFFCGSVHIDPCHFSLTNALRFHLCHFAVCCHPDRAGSLQCLHVVNTFFVFLIVFFCVEQLPGHYPLIFSHLLCVRLYPTTSSRVTTLTHISDVALALTTLVLALSFFPWLEVKKYIFTEGEHEDTVRSVWARSKPEARLCVQVELCITSSSLWLIHFFYLKRSLCVCQKNMNIKWFTLFLRLSSRPLYVLLFHDHSPFFP